MTKKEFFHYVASFNKNPGEYSSDEIYEIGIKHKELPVRDRNWNELVAMLGIPKTGNALRKYIGYHQAISNTASNTIFDYSINEADELITAKSDELHQMKLEKIKLQDEIAQYRKLLRSEARAEEFKDKLLEAIEKTPKLDIYTYRKKIEGNAEAVLMLSDFHIGAKCDNFYNVFNKDIARERLIRLVNDVKNYCLTNKVKKLNILNLGDIIAGYIHVNGRIEQEMNVTEQIMYAAELLAEALAALNDAASIVTYRSCLDNHGRMTPNLKEAIETENFSLIIDWYIKLRLKLSNSTIQFIDDNLDKGIGKFELLNGKKIMFAHGHLDSTNTAMQHFMGATEEFIHYVLLAHEHSEKVKVYQNVKVITNGSLIGTETYALSKRLFNKPTQTLLIFDENNVMNISIGLEK